MSSTKSVAIHVNDDAPAESTANNNNSSANPPKRKKKYPQVQIQPGQRIIDGKGIPTQKVHQIVDITGDKVEEAAKPKYCSTAKSRHRFLAGSLIAMALTFLMLLVSDMLFFILLAITGLLTIIACIVNLPSNTDPNSVYAQGNYDKQLKMLNKKAVYVQDPNGTITKFIVRTGPRRKLVDTGCTVM